MSSVAVNPAGDAVLTGSWDTLLRVGSYAFDVSNYEMTTSLFLICLSFRGCLYVADLGLACLATKPARRSILYHNTHSVERIIQYSYPTNI